ncbi:MAG: leucine--tRNA ligase [Candidatus Syntrophoarchaeum sp. WYZ-LMO15]|nr:MAG: leucine--tRNA ligase [Candidatus Syntrophoarchaeum sp. WYZ-LMO15]
MGRYDFKAVEGKWQKIWEDEGIYEANPGEGEKFYLNVAYPYPSGAMHVGHGRTYTVPDVIARFKRMRGYNVLFPMGFHVTGTPVIGVSNRIARGDQEAIRLYRDVYKVPKEVMERFTDPHEIVRYFSNDYTEIMRSMGLSIDWRRRFTTVDPQYSKFIAWQFNQLRKKGLVAKGEHPVKFCPNCDNPVGDHDLLEGEKATINEFTLIKFRLADGTVVPTATLRPETLYGVTNLWMKPDGDYVIAELKDKNERWLLSREAAEKLRYQDFDLEIDSFVKGSRFIDRVAKNPLNDEMVNILPATFVEMDMGTGIVMSVPAHAPFDYIALRDLHRCGKYRNIRPIPVIKLEGYGRIPAADVIDRMEIRDQHDERLEDATEELYTAEFNRGVMLQEFGGDSVGEARKRVRSELLGRGDAAVMYEFSERPVICRCNTPAVIKLLKDQWFLRYSDPEWKDAVKSCIREITRFIPPELESEFLRTVDWLNDWACTRRVGLGTPLPWDPAWIIEPLSDSTIYMAYYTIAHYLKELDPDLIDDGVFDTIFLQKDSQSSLDPEIISRMREEFLYWYPYDYRLSAKDLISNHLTFQLFHHASIFRREHIPRGIVVFGIGLLEGEKMSSSKGNVILLKDAIERFGADTIRFFLMGSAEPWQDFDWRDEQVTASKRHLERFWNTVNEIIEMGEGEKDLEAIDYWLLNRLQDRIRMTINALEGFLTRSALQQAFFGIESDLRWYRRRTETTRPGAIWTMRYLADCWVRLLAPFIPHMTSELLARMGKDATHVLYPEVDEEFINPRFELEERLIEATYNDINEILRVTKITPRRIILYAAPEWKQEVKKVILTKRRQGRVEMSDVMREVMENPEIRRHAKEVPRLVKRLIEDFRGIDKDELDLLLSADLNEYKVLESAKEFFEQEFGAKVLIFDALDAAYDPAGKSALAYPMKPAIFVE